MHAKQCLKCGHGAAYELDPPTACPGCGAIYAKVEQALRGGAPVRPRAAAQPEIEYFSASRAPAAAGGAPGVDVHTFARHMRGESLYPVWRRIVGICTIVAYVIAAIGAVASLISMQGSINYMLAGLAMSALIAIFAKAGKELSLMVADLSDAAVRMAAANERQQ